MRQSGRRRFTAPFVLSFVVAVPQFATAQFNIVQVPLDPNRIPQFVQPLPTPGSNGIPVASNAESLTLSMCEFQTQILPAGSLGRGTAAPATYVWGYAEGACPDKNTVQPRSYLGPVILAKKDQPTRITYKNALGNTATSNVVAYKQGTDQTLMWADPVNAEANDCAMAAKNMPGQPPSADCLKFFAGPIPAAPHLHGGEIPAFVDGGPDAWWTGEGQYGRGYFSVGGTADAAKGEATYVYPNTQEPAPIWFHDHVLGATRLNVYAGLAGAYVIGDPKQGNPNYPARPDLTADLVPLVLQDRMFDTTGQLYFPVAGLNPEHPWWIPEFVGNVIVVNGKAWPFHQVQAKRYRLLFINGSNARAYELSLINKATGAKGPAMWVIGSDQGYLKTAAKLDPNVKPNDKLVIMPGERYQVVVDFTGLGGQTLLMTNTAKTPYPHGGPVQGRTTGRVMEFRVSAGAVADTSWNPASDPSVRVDQLNRFVDPVAGTLQAGVTVHKTRRLTLNEAMGPGGPLEVLVNNTRYDGKERAGNRLDFTAKPNMNGTLHLSELPNEGETEIWEIVNLTADAHPIHPHLVGFQVLNRQAFDLKGYDAAYNAAFPGGPIDPATGVAFPPGVYAPGYGPPLDYNNGQEGGRGIRTLPYGGNPDVTPFLLGAARPPTPAETGWKDTVVAYPGEVTRILIRFAPTHEPVDAAADTIGYAFDPGVGHGYVWHCHIIDHEDNEMMRPMAVEPNAGAPARTFSEPVAPPQ
jgi:FtsP/CotA-like multicopper oxidase with cupredoxin domain